MNILQSGLGIDVAANTLQCTLKSELAVKLKVRNVLSGFEQLLAWLKENCDISSLHVLLEASGNYHLGIAHFLEQAGIRVTVMNPRQARDLAKGLGLIAKTDSLDADALATAAQVNLVKGGPLRSELHRDLRDLSRQIQKFTNDKTRAKKRAGTPYRSEAAKASDLRMIAWLEEEIRELEKSWKKLLELLPLLKERYELALSVKGVGHNTARVLVSELPCDLNVWSPKQLAAYAGCAPMDNSSGTRKGHPKPAKTGNRHIRAATFMIGLLAATRDPQHSKTYQRLLSAGRHHFQAVRAVEHTIVRQTLAVMKRGTPWRAH